MNVRSHRSDGFVLKAYECGSVTAPDVQPLVVLVHGMMEPASVWQPMMTSLAQRGRVRCVALELPWNGEQGGLWGQVRSPMCWLAHALTAFELRADAFVAHSFGASALLSLMSRGAPQHQAPVVLISPFYKSCHKQVTWQLFERYVGEFVDFVELSIRTRLGERVVEPDVLQRMTHAARDSFGCYVWMQFWQLFSAMPFLPLEQLKQPVLTLTGAEDFSTPLPDVHALQQKLPNGRLEVYAGASHFLLASRGRAVIDATQRFVAEHCLSDPTQAKHVTSEPPLNTTPTSEAISALVAA